MPSWDDKDDDRDYLVVVNQKGDWSVWLAHKPVPKGWKDIGVKAKKQQCLDFIEDKCVFGDPESYLKD